MVLGEMGLGEMGQNRRPKSVTETRLIVR